MESVDWQIKWVDFDREPKCDPNPNYPDGTDVDVSDGATKVCSAPLVHPTLRCGAYFVSCRRCGATAAATTAGRPDDPRSLKMACKAPLQ